MNQTGLQFHIDENDYFGTLATVLDLASQDLHKKGHLRNAENSLAPARPADVPPERISDRENRANSRISRALMVM